MATAVNFTALSSIVAIGNTDQLLVRLDNSLSGSSGFARITKTALLCSVNVSGLSGNWQNTWTSYSNQSANNVNVFTSVNANSANWNNTWTSYSNQSARNVNVFTSVNANSANWQSAWTSYNAQSAALFNSASSPSQGTVRLLTQDLVTFDVDTGLQTADSPRFAGVTVNGVASAATIVGTLSNCKYVATTESKNTPNYAFALGDESKTIIDSYSTNSYYGITPNSDVTFSIGTQIVVVQGNKSASNYTVISAGGGVTVNSYNNSLSLAGNYAAATLIKTGTDTWYLIGNLQ